MVRTPGAASISTSSASPATSRSGLARRIPLELPILTNFARTTTTPCRRAHIVATLGGSSHPLLWLTSYCAAIMQKPGGYTLFLGAVEFKELRQCQSSLKLDSAHRQGNGFGLETGVPPSCRSAGRGALCLIRLTFAI